MNDIVAVAAVDADCGGDRPRAGAGARGAERDARAAGGDETGGCADVELALARDAVAAAPARDTDGLGRRGERAVGAARTAEGEGRAAEGEAGGGANIDYAAIPHLVVARDVGERAGRRAGTR